MAERVSSDHPSVTTIHATLARRGATRRPEVVIPEADADHVPVEGTVRLVIDDTEYHAPVEERSGGERALAGAYANQRRARERDGNEHLGTWRTDAGLSFGRTVLLDVVIPEFRYGLRPPGTEAVYDARRPPAEGLRDIADSLGDGAED